MPTWRNRIICLFFIGLVSLAAQLHARDPAQVAAEIDQHLNRNIEKQGYQPGPIADDAEFLRRAYLDITGRIPTAKEAATFLDDTANDKRAKLINQLLDSPNYGDQLGKTWRDWIAPAELPSEGNGGNQPIKQTLDLGQWFSKQFNAGKSWDTITRELLLVDGSLKEAPQGLFYSLIGDDMGKPQPAGITRSVGSLFLGVQLQCAECHNDPFKDWKQEQFWGMAAMFRNTAWTFNGRYFDSVTEATPQQLKELEKSAEKEKRKKPDTIRDKAAFAKITIPPSAFKNAGDVITAKLIDGTEVTVSDEQPLRPIFVDWLVADSNPYFARAFVNRLWYYYFARGLLHPIDDFGGNLDVSQPEVLDLLTNEFKASKYDVRHLIRCLTNTNAYQRTSRPAEKDPAKVTAAFARMPIKVMTADMLFESLKLAMNEPKLDLRAPGEAKENTNGESSPVGDPYLEFTRLFTTNEEDSTDLTHGIPQYLAFLNHPYLRNGGNTVPALIKAKTDNDAAIEQLYLGTISRRPNSQELTETRAFIDKSGDQAKAWNGILWMLVNRSEFMLIQ